MSVVKINSSVEVEQYGSLIEARLRDDTNPGCEKIWWSVLEVRDTLLARMKALWIERQELATNNEPLLTKILQ